METTKITAEPLMIGDWVSIDNKPHKVTGIQICDGIMCVQTDYTDTYYSIENYAPIPLTADVLEKNGWYIPKNSSWWQNNEVDFYIVGYTDGLFEIYTDGDSEFSNLCRINHVHELQNLYRICRINKEIVL